MMRPIISQSTFAMTLIALCGSVLAGVLPPMPIPLTPMVERADVIVVATIVAYQPAAGPASLTSATNSGTEDDNESEISSMTFQPQGDYRFKAVCVIKGKCSDEFEIRLPRVSAFYYARQKFSVSEGAKVLLFFKQDSTGARSLVDPLMPLIPISATLQPLPHPSSQPGSPPTPDQIDFLVPSLTDDKLRVTLGCILQTVKDDRVSAAMRPFADDPNTDVRVPALNCLALNQDVQAIPKIAATVAELEKKFGGTGLVGALYFYKDPAAVKYLNPLILEGSDIMRLNAMSALRPMADESSIPYLIKALDKDDRQRSVAYDAYFALHRLIGTSLPPALSQPQFYARKEDEIAALKQWWEWEQLKAKRAAATSTKPATTTTAPATNPK